ncbi:glycosyltransferase [Hymenobacter metallicola]|uniref:Glycosyltransferase n=1 Tax=Hymenobacter metallicola TaxID=2563114 RepID=A0A4Z0QFY8_9BACT|nr:glycosyltransferase [Hymenobacter metallicola]TGE28664.1 glycosyltransferase [Hymenobacter metallicola]
MALLATLLNALLYAVGAFLLLNCLYLLFFAVAGHRPVRLPFLTQAPVAPARRLCVLIPAYRADAVILETARAALHHAYAGPKDVVVVADGLQPATLQHLRQLGAQVVEVQFERSTKGKALLHALTVLPAPCYDVALVLDADNLMAPGCLDSINAAFGAGYKVVQTHRTAKNQNTAFALLDACNEEINNHLYRKGPFAVGLSAALIGSGMAFDYGYLRQLLSGIGETVGEDKEMDFRIARDQQKICYLDAVLVYDEKIEDARVFTQQRTRWLASQLEFVRKYSGEGIRQLRRGNGEFFNKVVQAYLVPRTLLIGVLGFFFLLSLLVPAGPPVGFWAGLLLGLAATLLGSLPARLYNRQLLAALLRLPYAIACMVVALLRVHRTKTSFLATPHKLHDSPLQVPS